jgi:hypothetical protein
VVQYTHGGASLQEVAIPVVEISYNTKKEMNKTKAVGASCEIGLGARITSYNYTLVYYNIRQ